MTVGSLQADKRLFQKPSFFTLISIFTGYRQHLRVAGNSMESTISEGDLVIYKKINPKKLDLEVGDIVIASHPQIKNKLIIKRIHQIYQNKFILRGDNTLSSTDSRDWGLIKLDLIIGKVEQIINK